MRPERVFDLVVWFLIVAGGLITAYVCFGILSSEASGKLKEYSVGGAIAGALVSWGVLTSVYLQLRGSSGEIEKLRERADELQHKLIRGAPRPLGFDIEIDERQRIVLARPKDWQPKGGTIFDLELPDEKLRSDDTFAPAFRCHFGPVDRSTSRDEYYKKELALLKEVRHLIEGCSTETTRIGDEMSGVESLKVIVTQFARIEIRRKPETGRTERTWITISKDEFTGRIYSADPTNVPAGKPQVVRLSGYGFRKGGTCYIGDQARKTRIDNENAAVVTLTEADVAYPRQLEMEWENAGTNGMRSRPHVLVVSDYQYDADKEDEVPSDEAVENAAQEAVQAIAEAEVSSGQDLEPQEEKQVLYQELGRMRVFCYHAQLERIYVFDFWDDARRFNESSATFNRVLNSVRFLT